MVIVINPIVGDIYIYKPIISIPYGRYDNQFTPLQKKRDPGTYGQPLSVTGWSDAWSRRCNGRTWPNCTNCQERFGRVFFMDCLAWMKHEEIPISIWRFCRLWVEISCFLFALLISLHSERWTDILLAWAKSQHPSWAVMRQFFRWLS